MLLKGLLDLPARLTVLSTAFMHGFEAHAGGGLFRHGMSGNRVRHMSAALLGVGVLVSLSLIHI